MKRAILILNLVFAVAAAQAQTPVPAWVQRYNEPGNRDAYPSRVAVTANGDVLVTGGLTNDASGYDYVTIKYSNAGMPLWTNRYDGPQHGDDSAIALATDAGGNVFLTGVSWNGSIYDYDYATLKYSSEGQALWTNSYDGPGDCCDLVFAVGVDGNNDAIVTGVSGTNSDYTTIKYSNGGVPLWTNWYSGSGNYFDAAYGLGIDSSNNVIVTGQCFADSFHAYATIKYSSGGVPLWTNYYRGAQNMDSIGKAVAVDGHDNVIVTGSFVHGNGMYLGTIKYSGAGLPLWTNSFKSLPRYYHEACAIIVDSSNNVIVTGFSWDPPGSECENVTIKYSGDGLPLWTNYSQGPSVEYAIYGLNVVVDSSNNVIVVGSATNDASGFDYVTIEYSGAGVPLWTNRYDGPGHSNDFAGSIAIDRSGNVFVTGNSWNGTNYDFATIKYSLSPSPIPLSIQTLNNQVLLSWTNAAFGLQSAPTSTGLFTNLPGATSPYTNPISGAQQFFRLISN